MPLTPEQLRQVKIARKMAENFWTQMAPELKAYNEVTQKILANAGRLPHKVVEQAAADQEENSRLMALLAEVAQKKGEE
jgi:hypothetical protein